MQVLDIKDEDCINYKEISMFIATPFCSGKCWKDLGLDCSICQNEALRKNKIITVDDAVLIERFDNNPLSTAVVFGGMEPFDSFKELEEFLYKFRHNHTNTVVIYTGYKEDEIKFKLDRLKSFKNIIVKFGRYVPNDNNIYDKILGVTLASTNQYAKEI